MDALNKMSDSGAEALLEIARASVSDDSPAERSEAYFHIGVLGYRAGAPAAEIREAFRAAVANGLEEVEARPPANPRNRIRIPWELCDVIGLGCAFGTPEQRARIGRIEREKLIGPERPMFSEQADAAQVLQAYLRGELDRAAAASTRDKFRRSKNTDIARFSAPLIDAVVALYDRDPAHLDAAIGALVTEHRDNALTGELQLLPSGLIASIPLGIAQLGREIGLACTIESPYLPLFLLE